MKKIISLLILVAMLQTALIGQCGVRVYNFVKPLDGLYLRDAVIKSNRKTNIRLVLNAGTVYAIYLGNTKNNLPSMNISDKSGKPVQFDKKSYNEKENYASYVFTVKKTAKYHIDFDFKTREKSCVLFTLFFMGRIKE